MRALGILLVGALLTACSALLPARPAIECQIPEEDCDAVVDAATTLLRQEHLGTPARMVVIWGRAYSFHAEVHTCLADRAYVLIDATGPIPIESGPPPIAASLRSDPWDDPPCD